MAAKNSSRAGRVRKPSSRLKDNALIEELSAKETRWCKVLCIEDNKSYYCPIAKLESKDGLGLSSIDIGLGTKVIWKYKGRPYEAEIVSVYDKNPKSSKDVEPILSSESDEDLSIIDENLEVTSLSNTGIGKKFALSQDQTKNDSSSQRSTSEAKRPRLCDEKTVKQTESQTENGEETEDSIGITFDSQSSTSSSSLIESDLIQKIWDRQNKMDKKINKILLYLKPKPAAMVDISSEEIAASEFVTENGINLLSFGIRQPDKYALALLDALFTEDELACSCYATTKRSKKTPLPEEKVAILENVLKKLFGEKIMLGSDGKIIRQKCNQKCIDLFNKKVRVKKDIPHEKNEGSNSQSQEEEQSKEQSKEQSI